MKKALIIAGTVLGLLLVLLLVAPILIPKDKIRDEITLAVEENTNSKMVLGSISLGLLPKPHVVLNDISLKHLESHQRQHGLENPLFQAEQLDVGISVMAFLTGTIELSLEAEGAKVYAKKLADGRNSAELLSKPDPKTSFLLLPKGQFSFGESAYAQQTSNTESMDESLKKVRLNLYLKDSELSYQDGDQTLEFKPIDLSLNPLTVQGQTDLELELGVDLKLKDNQRLVGPLKIEGALQMNGAKLIEGGEIQIDASSLKSEGLPVRLGTGAKLTATVRINNADLERSIADVNLAVSAIGADISSNITQRGETLSISGSMEPYELKQLEEYLTEPVEDLEGKLGISKFTAAMAGESLSYSANIDANGIAFTGAAARLGGSGQLKVTTGKLDSKNFKILVDKSTILADIDTEFDPVIAGKIGLSSQSLDISKFVPQPNSKEDKTAWYVNDGHDKRSVAQGPKEEMNPLLGLAADPRFAKMNLTLALAFKKITLQPGYMFDSIIGRMICKAKVCDLAGLKLRQKESSIDLNGKAKIFDPRMTSQVNLKLQGVEVTPHLTAWAPEFAEAITGTASGTMNVDALLYPESKMQNDSKASADLALKDGVMNLIVPSEVINSGVGKIVEAVPMVSGYKDKVPSFNSKTITNKYKAMNLKFNKASGTRVNIERLDYTGSGNQSIDMKSKGHANFDGSGEIIGRIWSNSGQPDIKELKDSKGRPTFAIKCKLPDCHKTIDKQYMAKAVLDQNKGKAKKKIKAKAKELVKDKVKKDDIKKEAKKLLKGFGF